MPKNIVIFSDGTGQEGGKGNNTNVYKLFNMIEDRTARQVSFYDRGIGTGWRKITSNAGGKGISKNIKDCYRFIFEQYEAGDRIYLFGFSRGAATVRSLASFIDLVGILPKSRPELIEQAYSIYRKKEKREALAKAFVHRNHTMWTKIHFIGVWDTVAALGVPVKWLDPFVNRIPTFRHLYHDFALKEGVNVARHALAIDDVRKPFHPTFFEPLPEQDVKQVWFAGMHTDVGGGYAEAGLSDIALEWLVHEAVAKDLLIYPGNKVASDPDPDGFMHDSRDTWWSRAIYPVSQRDWPRDRLGDPVVHVSVTERMKSIHNETSPPYSPWILNGAHTVES